MILGLYKSSECERITTHSSPLFVQLEFLTDDEVEL